MEAHLLKSLLPVALAALCYFQIFLNGPKPSKVPWAPSGGRGVVAAVRSSLACLFSMPEALNKAREMILETGKAVAVSTILDGPIVILPMSMQQWYSGQEGAGISFLAMMQSRFQYDYTLPDVSIDYSRQLAKVLFRRTKSAIPTVHDEVLQLALPDNISGYQFWQVYPDMLIAFVRVTNRMLVGEDMCRDKDYIWSLTTWIYFVVPLALFLRCLPRFIRHPVGLLLRQVLRYTFHRRLEQKLLPITTKVIDRLETTGSLDSHGEDTFVSWFAAEAYKSADPEIRRTIEPKVLATVIINLNFASLHSSIETTNALFDILSYGNSVELVQQLREEIRSVMTTLPDGAPLTWSHLEEMRLLDAVIKESLRLHPVELATNPRMVTETLITPDGTLLSPGTKACLLNAMGNQDDTVYAQPSVFNPYRFANTDQGQSSDSSYTISPSYLSFGYGRRACPGRWFATASMKMILCRLLMEYDILPIPERPKPFHVGMMPIPSPLFKIQIRKRVTDHKEGL